MSVERVTVANPDLRQGGGVGSHHDLIQSKLFHSRGQHPAAQCAYSVRDILWLQV